MFLHHCVLCVVCAPHAIMLLFCVVIHSFRVSIHDYLCSVCFIGIIVYSVLFFSTLSLLVTVKESLKDGREEVSGAQSEGRNQWPSTGCSVKLNRGLHSDSFGQSSASLLSHLFQVVFVAVRNDRLGCIELSRGGPRCLFPVSE